MLSIAEGIQLCGRFTLLSKIGSGGHGEVWRARDALREHEIALKVVHGAVARSGNGWEALEREYELAQRLAHPGILEVFEPMRDGQLLMLPMELATGDLRRMRGEPYTRIVPMLLETAEALSHAHSRGVIHRDLKPGNVLIDNEGRIKLADFGTASRVDDVDRAAFGSPFSASPQQIKGEPATASDDIYGLGALAYELLSGYPPFYPRFDARAVVSQPAPQLMPIHPVPPRLADLVMRMLAKTAAERPASMEEVIGELHAALQDTVSVELPALSAADVASQAGETPNVTAADGETAGGLPPLIIEDAVRARRADSGPARGPMRPVLIALVALVALLGTIFFVLPRFAAKLPAPTVPVGAGGEAPADSNAVDPEQLARANELRASFESRLAALEEHAAPVWGGAAYAAARSLGTDGIAALDAGDFELGIDRIETALRRLDKVDEGAAAALHAQLAESERAFKAGQTDRARQAAELALRIKPDDAAAKEALARTAQLPDLLQLLADGANAAAAGEPARAAEFFQQALALAPDNADAKAGLTAARAAMGADAYAGHVADGYAALKAGKLDAARSAFEAAAKLRSDGPEAQSGLAEVAAAGRSGNWQQARSLALGHENMERWADAQKIYEGLLKEDGGIAFARQGLARVRPRATLASALQGIIDAPQRLAAAEVRNEADSLLEQARGISPQGPVLRSQIARIELLLPEYDKPVSVVLESDDATTVSITRVGQYGSFMRRQVELKPGRYVVVGTRTGYRDVRREIVVTPGESVQTVIVRCDEAI
ncbi:MAG: serine/threonine-protein kinase [Steroidobacteraceae bacterium]